MCRTLVGGVLLIFRDGVDVFHSPVWLDQNKNEKELETHKENNNNIQ